MNNFKINSNHNLKADQLKAVDNLVTGIKSGKTDQVLLGVTGSGKTFTIANVIERVNKPTLIFAHNKTLAGQLYSEFKELFPNNKVEYFVSSFDFYQPEAYVAKTDTYIEKTASINNELEMLYLSSLNSLLERKDTIVIASVACIYATSNPELYRGMITTLKINEVIDRQEFIKKLVSLQYKRNDNEHLRGTFKVKGEVVEITPGYSEDFVIRVEFYDDTVERIVEVDAVHKKVLKGYTLYNFFPAVNYARNKDDITRACNDIEIELNERLEYFKENNKYLEYERLSQRTKNDLETLREIGYCRGIENYSMHIDNRKKGQRPYNIFDYFGDDFLVVIDESHASIPQIKAMFKGDRSRKNTLVEYGFRLPSALENRPMTFEEFEAIKCQKIYVSATPGDYELNLVNNNVIEQIIRPTGLLDPVIELRNVESEIDDIYSEILKRIEKKERTIITTLRVETAEKLTSYFRMNNLKVAYIHHEIKTLDRIEILLDLRKGKYDVLVGVNLLREGLDLPEVSLVCIVNADVEGIFRDYRSLIQIIGRAARNVNGKVIMYHNKITISMQKAIEETKRRRLIQENYNKQNNIIPKSIVKTISEPIRSKETKEMMLKASKKKSSKTDILKLIDSLKTEMKEAASQLNFERAMELRDLIMELEND